MSEHSKLPFRAAQHNDTAWAVLSGDMVVAIMDRTDKPELNKPNAALIVLAVNAHKDLLTACEKAEKWIRALIQGDSEQIHIDTILQELVAAIAAAKP